MRSGQDPALDEHFRKVVQQMTTLNSAVALIVEDFQVHIGKLMPAFKRRLERNQDHPDQLHPLLVALVAAADEFDVIAKGFFCS
ncbi:uncharacterized protein EHS24_002922 [Apiotrichum porosum]|uniref:Uncharacterized protein n=1 Tax=Apiotrichum porosum TaxID=105984 RepID=A0A427XGG5_9TREE|nr:uncharacterized protein EHS24_002922 [Apiotrichum porosum]RSH77857.1 hypothetical protein EHS24_002922 [Apiotrichum porosum]